MGEVLCVNDKDLSVAGGVGQGTLRPTDGQGGTPTFKNVLKCAVLRINFAYIAQWFHRDTLQLPSTLWDTVVFPPVTR